MNARENVPTEYCGKPYTKYEALQRQRRLETKMRAQRRQIKLLQEGNAAEDDIINARCRYRGTSQEYSRFSKAMGIPQQRERVTVDGLGDVGKGKWKIGGEKMRVDNEEKIDYSKKSDIMKRKKGLNRSDVRFITDKRFNELTIEAKKNGANIVRGSVEVEKHLDFMGADAATVGDTLLFKRNVCVSEVIEETHHFMQNIQGLNFDKAEPLRTYLNEIEAKEYLLLNREKYNIPRSECETTKKQLAYYKELLEQYRKEQTKQ